jgi:hypothetical protein
MKRERMLLAHRPPSSGFARRKMIKIGQSFVNASLETTVHRSGAKKRCAFFADPAP